MFINRYSRKQQIYKLLKNIMIPGELFFLNVSLIIIIINIAAILIGIKSSHDSFLLSMWNIIFGIIDIPFFVHISYIYMISGYMSCSEYIFNSEINVSIMIIDFIYCTGSIVSGIIILIKYHNTIISLHIITTIMIGTKFMVIVALTGIAVINFYIKRKERIFDI